MKLNHLFLILFLLTLGFNSVRAQEVKTVVIDAGHGGHDPGAIGATSLFEKDVALEIALLVGGYIEELLPEVNVIYTRTTDVFLELHERSQIANDANADLFISIHFNSASNPAASGSESYVLGLHRSDSNLEVAKRENAVIELEDDTDHNYDFNPNSPEGHIMLSMAQNAYLEQSIQLANNVQYQFRERVSRKDRGVKQAGFYVLYKTTMPSVLIELGFLSNPEEEAFLKSTNGKEYMASAIYRAFRDYKVSMDELWIENQANKIKEEEPIETITPEPEPQMEYRIQVYASKYAAKKGAKIFDDFEKVTIEDNGNGVLRHMVNSYDSYDAASLGLLKVVELGYKGAYVVGYVNNVRAQVYDVTTGN